MVWQFWPIQFGPILFLCVVVVGFERVLCCLFLLVCCVCVCVCVCVLCVVCVVGVFRAPLPDPPKFRSFFSLSHHNFYSFLPLFWSFSLNFGGVF